MTWLPRNTVVVPIDFSDDSFAALQTARELAHEPGHLHLIHVLPVLDPLEPGIIWSTVDDESRSQHATDALRQELVRRECDDGMHVAVRFGNPGNEIARYAKEVNAGLIVVSSHGRTGLRHLFIGSVAERIVHLAHCPVLVLKK